MDIAGLAAKPKDVLDTLDLTTLGVNSSCIFESVPLQLKTLRHYSVVYTESKQVTLYLFHGNV